MELPRVVPKLVSTAHEQPAPPPQRPPEWFIFSPKGEHAAEITSMKDEVSRKLPWIAEKAVAEAGRQWRKRAEEETAAVRTERDRRLREFQVQDTPRGTALTCAWCQEKQHPRVTVHACYHG